ncbi:MAG: hypothetical protein LQ337_000347 [Flavoplaca oasis]|nr:MAG: hypothetical protein LQ337_000347 [Flavoplaca oasis]
MTSTIGIPIKLLNEAQNHVVTLEITSGQVYRGKLIEAEDNMNVQLKDITVTARDGRVSHLDQVYIRGSHVRFFIVPDMLRNAPMFRSRGVRGRGVGSELPLSTPYYSTNIPIWNDNIAAHPATLDDWQNEWSAPEAGEVVKSIGAWVVVVRKPASKKPDGGEAGGSLDNIRNTLSAIHKVITHHQGISSDRYTTVDNEPLLLLIGMPQPLRPLLDMSNEQWEDLGLDCGGWQWIDSEAKGKNEFGENVGLERLKEALEANEWDGAGGLGADDLDLEEELGLREHEDTEDDIELERDGVVGLHKAILEGHASEEEDTEGDAQVEELESMMLKMQAIKGLP